MAVLLHLIARDLYGLVRYGCVISGLAQNPELLLACRADLTQIRRSPTRAVPRTLRGGDLAD